MHGDVVDIHPAQGGDYLIRVEFFGDEIDRIAEIDPLTNKVNATLEHTTIFQRHIMSWRQSGLQRLAWTLRRK